MQDHIKTFSMRLLWLDVSMFKLVDEMMRSEFEKLFKSQRSYRSSDKEAFIRGCEAAFKHQQSKIDELTKQRDSFIKAYEIEMDKSLELQKRVDALKGLVIELKKLDMENGSIEITSEFVEEIICDFEQALKGGEE